MIVPVIVLKYALLVRWWSYGHFLKLIDSILFKQHDKSSPFNSTHNIVSYPQNGDRIVLYVSYQIINVKAVTMAYNAKQKKTPKLLYLTELYKERIRKNFLWGSVEYSDSWYECPRVLKLTQFRAGERKRFKAYVAKQSVIIYTVWCHFVLCKWT